MARAIRPRDGRGRDFVFVPLRARNLVALNPARVGAGFGFPAGVKNNKGNYRTKKDCTRIVLEERAFLRAHNPQQL